MTIETMLTIVGVLVTLGGSVLSLPWPVQRKLREAIDECLQSEKASTKEIAEDCIALALSRELPGFYTKLEAVTMFISKAENERRFEEIRNEMARNHRPLVAVAMKLEVRPELLDG